MQNKVQMMTKEQYIAHHITALRARARALVEMGILPQVEIAEILEKEPAQLPTDKKGLSVERRI